MSLFKDRGVAMGKPHCNSSICSILSYKPEAQAKE
jgi:hypothetical protein